MTLRREVGPQQSLSAIIFQFSLLVPPSLQKMTIRADPIIPQITGCCEQPDFQISKSALGSTSHSAQSISQTTPEYSNECHLLPTNAGICDSLGVGRGGICRDGELQGVFHLSTFVTCGLIPSPRRH